MTDQTNYILSPFYVLFDGAMDFTLWFPADEDGIGPFWHESGELVVSQGNSRSEEDVELVELGDSKYRLASKSYGPFSQLRLHWGDEFFAERSSVNVLVLLRVAVPCKYKHYQFITSSGFDNNDSIARLVHHYEGGWEAVAEGILTLSVPAHTALVFEQEMRATNLFSGFLQLED